MKNSHLFLIKSKQHLQSILIRLFNIPQLSIIGNLANFTKLVNISLILIYFKLDQTNCTNTCLMPI